eukprot:CAMPEP_0167778190 /NCGR_PEP_ID=MMETSP0111_2-20121227/4117_1 /TAXON_ID=91324 /ORGANISM="Lotharella globosa, Strain CCCM811" /LENGTH=143 /DNA_ID=CAMNT_0007668469 /DNA_START=434 /DNA_END=865 /DNA_ORIENTATION=-
MNPRTKSKPAVEQKISSEQKSESNLRRPEEEESERESSEDFDESLSLQPHYQEKLFNCSESMPDVKEAATQSENSSFRSEQGHKRRKSECEHSYAHGEDNEFYYGWRKRTKVQKVKRSEGAFTEMGRLRSDGSRPIASALPAR